ncbi:MAG: (Fe-S)-binding protein, partial [Anaerolineales bacterium]|nr:(Fe-S)-binding protein [Anaerolineales bacterium]
TYHDSCHMCRMLGLKDHPRELLAAAGADLQEMEQSDRCCGFGGLFSIKMPEVSNEMTTAKIQRALATGAAQLVTSDPGCLMQMRGLAGDRVTVTHLAVLLAEASQA